MCSKYSDQSKLDNIKEDLDIIGEKIIMENYSNMDSIYNKKNTLLDLKRMNIENKKDKLNKLQNKLVTRNRLIEHTNKEIENKNKKINIMKKIYILFIVFLILIVMYYTHIIGINTAYILSFISVLLYLFYVMWSLNTLDVKSELSPDLEKVRAVVNYIGDQVYNEGNRLENEYKMYINENCKCPDKKDKKDNKDNNKPGKPGFPNKDSRVELNDGSYYYDGTAPKETKNNLGRDFAIEWETNDEYGSISDNKMLPYPSFFDDHKANDQQLEKSEPHNAKDHYNSFQYIKKQVQKGNATWTDNL
jgi:ABC-type multidrug transport system fused ATPase/permease subunit